LIEQVAASNRISIRLAKIKQEEAREAAVMRQAQVDEQNGIGSRFLLLFSTHRIPTFSDIAVVEFAVNIELSNIRPGTLLRYGRSVLEVLCLARGELQQAGIKHRWSKPC
jgi:hypothetical protein